MSAPKIVSEGKLSIYKKYMPLLLGTSVNFKNHDLEKISKIETFFKMTGRITEKQFRSFKHYCRIYKVEIPNSLVFILED